MNRSQPDMAYVRDIVSSLVGVEGPPLISVLAQHRPENRRLILLNTLKRELSVASVAPVPENLEDDPTPGDLFLAAATARYDGTAAFKILVEVPQATHREEDGDQWPLQCNDAMDCLGAIYVEDVDSITLDRPAGFAYEIDVPVVRDRNKRGGLMRQVVTIPNLLKSFFELDSSGFLRETTLNRYLIACYNYLVAEDMTRPLEKLEPVTFTNYGAPLGTVRARPYGGLSGGSDDGGLSGGPHGKRRG